MWGTLSTMRGSVNHVSIPPGRLPTLELEQPFKTLTQEIINIRKVRKLATNSCQRVGCKLEFDEQKTEPQLHYDVRFDWKNHGKL